MRTEVSRYHEMVKRLPAGEKVLISFDGKGKSDFDTTFFFKPPFGPYLPELKETFPVGQSEIPEWDSDMIKSGCKGIINLINSHETSSFFIACDDEIKGIVSTELENIKNRFSYV